MNDRKADHLKGNVQKVVEETANLKFESSKFVENAKEIDSNVEYDRKGNRIKRDAYSDGKIFLKVIYEMLDNVKIAKEEFIKIVNSPPILAVSPNNNSTKQEKKKDNRFSFKFKYKYDEKGNRIEEIWISDTGEIWIQDLITFDKAGNIIKQVRRHSEESKISSIHLFKYNDKSILVEETITDGNGNSPEKYESDEFDANGNWVKRTVKREKQDGSFEPFLVCYRKIAYFN